MLQIRWHGHSCFEITNDVTIVTDPHDGRSIGIPAPTVQGDIILVSHNHYDHNSVKTVQKEDSKVITDERKRTIGNIQITGIVAYHDTAHGEKRGKVILYRFICDDIVFCHLGDLGHELDEKTLQQIGKVDILFVPVGGNYTIDAEQAWNVIHAIKPRIAIPMKLRETNPDFYHPVCYPYFENPVSITEKVGEIIMHEHFEGVDLFSLNIPFEATLQTPLAITIPYRTKYGRLFHKKGNRYLQKTPPVEFKDMGEDTDLKALNDNTISLTPMNLSLVGQKDSFQQIERVFSRHW